MHLGAYFDPGMEFGEGFCRLHEWSREDLEQEFDRAFSGTGIRIIKSHVFCHHLDVLRQHWPESPIVTVYRPNDACLGWWVRCGHFGITYPLYHEYYVDLRTMSMHIDAQNHDLLTWINHNATVRVNNNIELCRSMGISEPSPEYRQYYSSSDVRVEVLLPKE